ncbi:MAG: hypothetical protein WDW36_007901 [Sanguina aurantia]
MFLLIVSPVIDTNLSILQRLSSIFILYGTLINVYTHFVVKKLPAGCIRLLFILPILVTNVAAASVFNHQEIISRTAVLFIITWLLSFKVLAACLDRGPLMQAKGLAQFTALLLLPIFPKRVTPGGGQTQERPTQQGRLDEDAGSPYQLACRWALKVGMLGAVVVGLVVLKDLPRVARDLLQAFGMYGFVGILMDGPASIVTQFLGLRIIPTFDSPWMSTCLADFWGRRWNITTSSVLRVLVYDVITDGHFVKQPRVKDNKPSGLRRAIGTCATFMISGLAHEFILWMLQPDGIVRWKWFTFFSIQGPMMLAEAAILPWCQKRGIQLWPWPSRFLTISILELGACYLFFAPVYYDTDTAERVIDSFYDAYVSLLPHLSASFSPTMFGSLAQS